jgi:hypothetical protein
MSIGSNSASDGRIVSLEQSPLQRKIIRQNMNFTQQKLPAAESSTSLACVIDFLEARDRLSAGFEETSNEFEIQRKVRKVTPCRRPLVGRLDRLEDSLYWLISVPTLAYLFLQIISP